MKLTFKAEPILILIFSLVAFISNAKGNSSIKPDQLSCEYRINPLGIDVSKPRLSWILSSTQRNQQQAGYEIIVSDDQQKIKQLKGNIWASGKVMSDQNIHVDYNGSPLKSFTRYYWRVKVYDKNNQASAWSAPQWFETAMLNPTDWNARWISDGSKQFTNDEDFYNDDRMPLFRKEFKTEKTIAKARLYISGLGYYEAYINGQKVGDHVLDPGWTSYSKQVLYTVYDISTVVKQGLNAAGIMVGNGWYNPLPMRFWGGINMRDALTTGRPCVKAMIRITYKDGTYDNIATDENWLSSPGPIVRNNVYLGEQYDARLEKKDWSMANIDANGWSNAIAVKGPSGKLSVQIQPPIKVTKIITPLSVTEVKDNVFVFDMGQNFAGVVRIKVKGPEGQRINIRYGEDKYADGNVNFMTSVAGQIKTGNGGPGAPALALQEDNYTLKGKGIETWAPRFTFHGFRYVEITGWPGKPSLKDIEGLRLSADLEQSGQFSSSNEMFNQLDKNIQWTFLSNVFSVQSDCPGREKLGYGGDLFCSAESFMYHFDMATFYLKTVNDFVDDQRPLGGITETMPFVGIADAGPGDKSGPMGFQIGFPYLIKKLYDFYGDKQVIEKNYDALTRQIKFLEANAKGHLFSTDLGDHESLDEREIPFTASVFYFLHAQLMADFAGILHKKQEETKYLKLTNTIKAAIQKQFDPKSNGVFENGTQSAQIFALWANISNPETKNKVFDALISQFEKKNWHLSTGIFGTKMLFDVLRNSEQNEMAYRIANQRDFPGWGYMIENGATTLWETWKPSDNTYSKNHPMFGSVGEWFYRSLIGINAAAPGFKESIIKPQPAGDLKWAKGTFNSVYGKITCAWEIKNEEFNMNVIVPANTTAQIWIPLKYGTNIMESGKEISRAIQFLKKEDGYAVYKTGSGNYSFTAKE